MRSSCSPGDKPCLSPAPEADSVPGVPSGRRAGFCTPMVSVLSQGARCCGTSPKTPPPDPKPCRKSASGGKAGGRHTQRGTRPAPASPPASPKPLCSAPRSGSVPHGGGKDTFVLSLALPPPLHGSQHGMGLLEAVICTCLQQQSGGPVVQVALAATAFPGV